MVGIRPLLLAILMLAAIPATAAANTGARIIVKREPGLTAAERADIRADADVRLVRTLSLSRTEVVTAAPGDAREALRELNADPDVVYAEPDFIRNAAGPPPNDPLFEELWALHNTGQDITGFKPGELIASIEDSDMDVLEGDGGFGDPGAWDHTTGAGQLVAVVDSGVEMAHGDLAENLLPGYDWIDRDAAPQDLDGHGTLVAGIIAAVAGNGKGTAGVAPDARILPLRVLERMPDGKLGGRVSDIVGALDFAGDQGVRVVNASFSSGRFSQAENDVIAAHPNTLFVVAAGNVDAGEDQTTPEYPCAYTAPNIICVGASGTQDEVPGFSKRGAPAVDLFAPGDAIWSTFTKFNGADSYNVARGTSFAAPHVAGVAALLLARNPSLDVPALTEALMDTADDEAPFTPSVSGGRANALNALLSVEADRDGDGVLDDGLEPDNCPTVPNENQLDGDADGTGDACEDGADPDSDGDGILDAGDACPYDDGAAETEGCPGTSGDTDADQVLDSLDNCDDVANPDQSDVPDGDGTGDACDADVDNDGHLNGADNCPVNSNSSQANADGDGLGDACDPTPHGHDNDGDGLPQVYDSCPDVYGTLANGCPAPPPSPTPPPNTDGDDRYDANDACPTEFAISNDGCPLPRVASLSGKVRKRGTRRSVTVKVSTTRVAVVRMTIERRRGNRWVRVKRRTTTTVGNRASVSASRLRRGRHRVVVALWSGAGHGATVTKGFRVR